MHSHIIYEHPYFMKIRFPVKTTTIFNAFRCRNIYRFKKTLDFSQNNLAFKFFIPEKHLKIISILIFVFDHYQTFNIVKNEFLTTLSFGIHGITTY